MASLSVTGFQCWVNTSSSVSFTEVQQPSKQSVLKLGSLRPTEGNQSALGNNVTEFFDDSFRFRAVAVQSSASHVSPFTEKFSSKKSRGRGLASGSFSIGQGYPRDCLCTGVNNCRSARQQIEEENDLRSTDSHDATSSQLPELREVLNLLRRRWEEEASTGRQQTGPGNVFLVGTGPGDPELLTVKALRLMQTADLVLYDRLASTEILDMVHPGALLLYVGKTSGYHSRTQEEIHELLLNFAEAGATVVRLKGGDPLVFGRGGEEMDFLQEQGIKVNVIPGVTAASGIAAQLGIPLTHRGAANSPVRFLTGHSRKGGD